MPFNSDNTYRDPRQRLQSSAYAPTNQGGPGNPGTANNMPNQQRPDPFNQYGYSGQSPSLGRYVPPMLNDRNNLQSWGQQGGYAYNIPNSYGNPQYNQFNSGGMSNPQFGQSQNTPPPMPQLQPAQRELLTMFSGLPGMSSVTDPYREQLRPPVPQMQANYGMQQPNINMQYGQPQGKPVSMDASAGYSRPPVPGTSYPQGPYDKTADSDSYGGPDDAMGYAQGAKPLLPSYSGSGGGGAGGGAPGGWFSDNIIKPVGNFIRNEMNDPNPMFDMRNMIPGMGGLAGMFNRPRGGGGAPPSGGGSGGPMQNYTGPRPMGGSLQDIRPAPGSNSGSFSPVGAGHSGSGSVPLPYSVPYYGGAFDGAEASGSAENRGAIQNIRPPQGGVRPPVPRSNRGRSSASLNAMRGEMSDDRIRNAVADMRAHEWRGRA